MPLTIDAELARIVQPLAEFKDHHLYGSAVKAVTDTRQTLGPMAAREQVKAIRESFRDVLADSYLTEVSN